jgi:hypothetical protein
MKLKITLLIFIMLLTVILEVVSYNISSYPSRIALIAVFLLLVLLSIVANSKYFSQKESYRKPIVFSIFFFISFCFMLRRNFIFSPSNIIWSLHTESFVVAQQYIAHGIITSGSQHSFLFSSPLLISTISNIAAVPFDFNIYITLFLYTAIIAVATVLLFETVRSTLKNIKGFFGILLPGLISFALLSFAYNERQSISLALLFLLMSFIFKSGLSDAKRAIIVLLFVVAITFGDSTAILLMIPFFFIFVIFKKKPSSIIYGLIPLAYLSFSAYTYILGLQYYTKNSYQGFLIFLNQFFGGSVASSRVMPWNRTNIAISTDVYVTSIAYLAILLTGAAVFFFGAFLWMKKRYAKRNDQNALFLAALFTLFVALVMASYAYIGGSVTADSTSSDVRTIAIVFVMLVLPYTLVSTALIEKISARKIVVFLFVILIVLASLRTFYEQYPVSQNDPVNVLEDFRVDSSQIYSSSNFIFYNMNSGSVLCDTKTGTTGFIQVSLRLVTGFFTSEIEPNSTLVFDINGLKINSLHTSPFAYEEAVNMSLANNQIYSNGAVLIAQPKR